ncbi:MAG: hypothetical protein WCP35_12305 [Verrucomicrobiota bacterium]
MRHSSSHSQSLVFRADAAAMAVRVDPAGLLLDCSMPWLAGPPSQLLVQGGTPLVADDAWLLQTEDTLAGVLLGNVGGSLESETQHLYGRLFALTRGLNRYRIWNFVPHINTEVAGVENYLAFNSGRHQAFTHEFGGISPKDLSAASAVGIQRGPLALAFVAGSACVEHFENPLQLPSARYPERYGKNSPLFARGSKVQAATGDTWWHLSGTASIRASETIGSDFSQQLEVTLENIQRMLDVMAVPTRRHATWKIFLRNRRHLALCREQLARIYPNEVDQMTFVEADICRRDLLLEIEAIFQQSEPSLPSRANPSLCTH